MRCVLHWTAWVKLSFECVTGAIVPVHVLGAHAAYGVWLMELVVFDKDSKVASGLGCWIVSIGSFSSRIGSLKERGDVEI